MSGDAKFLIILQIVHDLFGSCFSLIITKFFVVIKVINGGMAIYIC